MDLRFVTLFEIDLDDSSFEIHKFSGSTRLQYSLERFGVLDPVWLREKSGGYTVVDGFQRLRWAKENQAHGVLCRIFVESSDPREVWMRRIEKKIFEGEINAGEKAQIIGVLAWLFGPGENPGLFLPSLKIANRAETIRKWVLLSKKGLETLEALSLGDVSERAAIEIADWDQSSSDSVLSVLRALRCSASIQVELVERINEIAIREEKARAEVMNMERVREILSSEELYHREKTQALREYFTDLRNPRLSMRRKQFQRDMEAFVLPGGARIAPPEAFEGGGWRMELSFSSPEELRRIFRAAGSLVESDRLEEIFGKR